MCWACLAFKKRRKPTVSICILISCNLQVDLRGYRKQQKFPSTKLLPYSLTTKYICLVITTQWREAARTRIRNTLDLLLYWYVSYLPQPALQLLYWFTSIYQLDKIRRRPPNCLSNLLSLGHLWNSDSLDGPCEIQYQILYTDCTIQKGKARERKATARDLKLWCYCRQ